MAVQSVCTSTGQNDFGLHEFKFEDPRYNPFEFAGAISQWRFELVKDKDLRQFDYETISDVVLHIRHTAREGGARLRTTASQALKDIWTGTVESAQPLMRLFGARHEFPTEWRRFLTSTDETPRLKMKLQTLHFPYPFRDKSLQIVKVGLFAKRKDSIEPLTVWLTSPGQNENQPYDSVSENGETTKSLREKSQSVLNFNPMLGVVGREDEPQIDVQLFSANSAEAEWLIMTAGSPGQIEDLWLLLYYTKSE